VASFDVVGRLRAALTENFNLKLLSLLFALVLYSLVHGQDAQRTMNVALVSIAPPEGADRVLVTPVPPFVHVTMRGPHAIIDDLHPDDVGSLQIDLHSGNVSRITFDPSMVHAPAGVKVEQIDPPAIDLLWEDRLTRDIPVEVSLENTPAPGFIVRGAPVADPLTVRARGPRSEVALLQHVRADPFDVQGLTEGKHTHSLGLEAPPPRVTYEVPSVSVTVEVARELAERPFSKLPIAVVGQTKAHTQPADVDVRLSCPPDILRSLRPEQIVPRVQVTSTADHGSEALPVQVQVDGCDVHVTPATVVVRWGPS
jgi:YbbR domain-containing protein